MKIQLKRSNVLEGGSAKEPTAGQMEYGELAVNYSDTDPAIFIKDSADNIIRISGVGNIADDGQVEIPGSVNPPANPLPGNLWYNSEDGRLYVYYDDGNSSQWVDASPDNWQGSGTVPDPNDPNNQPGTLDDRYVNKIGDNMTGNLTLGTDKITLNATDGDATFRNGQPNKEIAINLSNTNNRIYIIDPAGGDREVFSVYAGGSTASNQRFAITNNGDIHLGGSAFGTNTYNTSLNANGSAKFAGIVTVGSSPSENTTLYPGGGVLTANAANYPTAVFTGVASMYGGTTIELKNDGSATFAGQVTAGETTRAIGTSGANIGPDGYVSVVHSSRGAADCLSIYDSLAGQEKFTCRIKGDGSAEFAGRVDVNNVLVVDRNSAATDTNALELWKAQGNSVAMLSANAKLALGGAATVASNNIFLNGSDGTAAFAGAVAMPTALIGDASSTVQINNNGITALIPGVGPTALTVNSAATFAGDVQVGANAGSSASNTTGAYVSASSGSFTAFKSDSNSSSFFRGIKFGSGTPFEIFNDGSAEFAGGKVAINAAGYCDFKRDISGTIPPAEASILTSTGKFAGTPVSNTYGIQIIPTGAPQNTGCFLAATGDWYFSGTGNTRNMTLMLEADDDTKYTSTTDSEGNETRVYNGAVLDVKERLQNVLARMDAMEANEITDDATDSALLTLIASLSARLDERDAQIAALTARVATLEG